MKRLAQVLVDTRATDSSGKLIAETTSSILFRGEGGFGGKPPPKDPAPVERPRDIPPTFTVEESTSLEQVLLYRLSGETTTPSSMPIRSSRAASASSAGQFFTGSAAGFMVRGSRQGPLRWGRDPCGLVRRAVSATGVAG